MDTPRAIPGRSRPAVRRLATALAADDRQAVPPDPLARELHLAVAALVRLGVGEHSARPHRAWRSTLATGMEER